MGQLKSNSIYNVLQWMDNKQMLIPVFQRKYVWKPKQIEELFESIMKDYPIGTFLFWKLNIDLARQYSFYNFLDHYHEMYEFLINKKAELRNSVSDIYSVIDGQQRLSSLYFGIKGYIEVRMPRKRKDKLENYEVKYLFLNIFKVDTEKDSYEFKFLNENGLKVYNNESENWWFKVNDIIHWKYDEIEEEFDKLCNANNIGPELSKNHKKIILRALRKLYNKINNDEIIGFFVLDNRISNTDKLLDIFRIVNSKGSNLKKNDLLFSTLTASWNEARDEIQDLVKKLDGIAPSFYSEDFILRCCLVLSDNNVLFDPEGFNENVVNSIKNNWSKIKRSALRIAELLDDLNINDTNLKAKNAIIPIMYYVFKGGSLDNETINEIKIYLIRVSLKKVFGSHGDSLLQNIREGLLENFKSPHKQVHKFKWEWINNSIEGMHDNKSLIVHEQDLGRILEESDKKNCKLILGQILDIDSKKDELCYLFPHSQFKGKKMEGINLPSENIERWPGLAKELPNMFLTNERNDSLIKIMNLSTNLMNQELRNLDLPPDFQTYNLSKFEKVFNHRKKFLRDRLEEFFELN